MNGETCSRKLNPNFGITALSFFLSSFYMHVMDMYLEFWTVTYFQQFPCRFPFLVDLNTGVSLYESGEPSVLAYFTVEFWWKILLVKVSSCSYLTHASLLASLVVIRLLFFLFLISELSYIKRN